MVFLSSLSLCNCVNYIIKPCLDNKLTAILVIYKIVKESVEVVKANRSIFIRILWIVSVAIISFK
jgi:hypothetical protein